MQRRQKYLLQRNICKNGSLVPLCERTTRHKFCNSNDARIGKKDLVVMVQKMKIDLVLLLKKNERKRNAPSNSKNLLDIKQRDSHQKNKNKEVGSSCLIREKQHFLNGSHNVVHSKLDSSCEFLDKTVLSPNSVMCPPEQLNLPDPFWDLEIAHAEDGFVPIVDFPSPPITQSRVLRTNSASDLIDLEPTPPCSSTSESIVSDSSYSEDNFPGYFSCLEVQNKEKVVEESLACQDNIICKTIQVAIVPLEPSLRQLQELYQRKKMAKIRKANNRESFRERCLRPSHSLRQFTPFMFDTPQTLQSKESRRKKGHNTQKLSNGHKKQKSGKKVKKQVSCQTQLFLNIKDDQFKQGQGLQQKKQNMKFRNTFDNALDSINKRIIRQSQFWKMLPG